MKHKKRHILVLTSEFPPQPGGIGQHALDLAKHLALQHEVTLIADQRSDDGEEEKIFDSRFDFNVIRVRRFKHIGRTYVLRLMKTLENLSKVDLIMASGKFSLWQIHIIKLRYPSRPVIAIIHGTEVLLPSTLSRKLTDKALEKADQVVAVSNYTLSLVEHLDIKKSQVIPNGISTIPTLETTSKDDQQINLLTVGNLTQRKGQHNVINALPALLEDFPQAHYHCVGLPTNLEGLKELAEQLEVSHAVSFHGRVGDEQKQKFYRESHIFLMLSERTDTGDVEGFGIAILEANAYGLPAIGSKGSGIEDAIKSGHSGYLVNPHDTDDIKKAVEMVLNDYPSFKVNAHAWASVLNGMN